jgi:fumarate hydratase subunit alpha
MDASNLQEKLIKALEESMRDSVSHVRKDIEQSLQEALNKSSHPLARLNLQAIIKNLEIAKQRKIPLCQDTGVPTFFLELGSEFPFSLDYKGIIETAIRNVTVNAPLRPNAVVPFTNANSGDNTGHGWPIIHAEFKSKSDQLRIRFLMKGGGSENCSALFMFSPTVTVSTICDKLAKWVIDARGKPCPPLILGIGVGGDASTCLQLAKESLFQPINQEPDLPALAEIKRGVVKRVNDQGFGPMGLGGSPTCLGATIAWAMRHPASFPVGLVVQCHAHRGGEILVNENGEVEIIG